jgi:DNA-directed RNA polymerase subunit RPC12/RpoP
MGGCLTTAKDTNKCSEIYQIEMVFATCINCNQEIQFMADPSKYKNPECQVCFSTNVSLVEDDEWECNFCKKHFLFQNEDEITCKCGSKNWDFFVY